MKIIFISGPLTSGGDGSRIYTENNIKTAEKYTIALANANIGFFCPHTHTIFHQEKGGTASEKFYIDLDMAFLKRSSDALLAIPGWEKSTGANEEIKWAKENNLTIFYPKDTNDLEEIKKWYFN